MSIKYCPECGSEVDPDSKYCGTCGATLKDRMETAEPSPPVKIQRQPDREEVQPAVKVRPAGANYANFWERLVAWIIDIIIIGIITWIITAALGISAGIFNFLTPMSFIRNLIQYIIGFVYFWGLESMNQGQTLGKMALRLRTVDETTLTPTTPAKYALNNLAKPHGFIILDLIIGVLINSGDPKNRYRLLQNLSETCVLKEQ
ncbi:MAG: RDD family protein [Promethearchaeota archaeon]|nr:MAG: RDD family protein [Candidatus Lokiarchaeota archaeon]